MASKKIVYLLAATIVVGAAISVPPAQSASKTKRIAAAGANSTATAAAAIKERLAALNACLVKADAKGMAAFWLPEGLFTDRDGNVFSGRAALERNFADEFQANGQSPVDVVVDKVITPSSDMALVQGTIKAKQQNADSFPISRFTMTLAKAGGQWFISSSTETAIPQAEIATTRPQGNPLDQLQWLVGDWTAERSGGQVTMKSDWVPSKNFIFCRFDIKRPDQSVQHETQVIGWDPRNGTPISWTFDSNGGFGQGTWQRRGKEWAINTTAVERNGSITTAVNVISPNSDGFSWQATNREVDGRLVGDTDPLKVSRVSK